jgi:uncharacterized spore protein YtfJ
MTDPYGSGQNSGASREKGIGKGGRGGLSTSPLEFIACLKEEIL